MTTEAGKRLLSEYRTALLHKGPLDQSTLPALNDEARAFRETIAAIEAESAAQAVTAALADLETQVKGLPDHSASGYEWECGNCNYVEEEYRDEAGRQCPHDNRDDSAISSLAVLTLIREARESLPGGGKS